MNTVRLHPIAEDYLVRLESAARALPSPDREELLAELRHHLAMGLTSHASDADVLNLLRDLGTPEEIVAAAGVESRAEPAAYRPSPSHGPANVPVSPWGLLEVLAVLGLIVGALFIPIAGPIVGICLAWGSSRWTKREKIVATVLTCGPLVVLALGAVAVMSADPGSAAMVIPTSIVLLMVGTVSMLGPLIAGAYLAIRLNQRR